MNPFPSILVPLDGSATAAGSLGCATWLAGRLSARLHILSACAQALPARQALQRLRVPEHCWPSIELHQAPAYPEEAILAAIVRHDVRLVVMTARGDAAESASQHRDPLEIVGHVAHTVIERSPVPVLLLPPAYREQLPWTRALVPLSGEIAADDALPVAVRLAHAVGLNVHVAHVVDADTDAQGSASAQYADAPHHEYPGLLDELVQRALPECTAGECSRLADVALCRGDVATELLNLIARKQISVLVIGWLGNFMRGHAHVLKHMLRSVTCPVLLVKPAPRVPFKLKVGPELG